MKHAKFDPDEFNEQCRAEFDSAITDLDGLHAAEVEEFDAFCRLVGA